MKRLLVSLGLLFLTNTLCAQEAERRFVIETSVGTMRGILYADVPNHVNAFVKRAQKGDFNGTLFTRVISGFMIQGGSPDSRNAPAGARIGFGDKTTEILPEFRSHYFHKKGALAAPRQGSDVNPQKKSDMSQFFIIQGEVYSSGELDTLELVKNVPIRRQAMAKYYQPLKPTMDSLKTADPVAYNRYATEINHKVDSFLRATPGHLLFTAEQREAYTTIGGSQHLDGEYTIYGEVTEGLEVIDIIANQERDGYDRPRKDIILRHVYVE
ncbi:peptidylprolyl isomerase [Parabacteroides sp. OttesenSCG-928-G07]|nr:peptidylprolyl isomerase [Parabacteroides sp. OttesenSCG-928-G07]